ncbi:MAG: helix-turn-helix domain-containing protein [Chloroflexota bacterium]|nr:helix-turn-helix domain-containing protein [Chloroflexota bacterium]
MEERLELRLRELRLAAGLTQGQLAERVGVSRQSINSIEVGRYVPGTDVALRLASVLDCRVEDIFRIAEADLTVAAHVQEGGGAGDRVVLGRVGTRIIGHPLRGTRLSPDGFVAADGIVGATGDVSLLLDERKLAQTALIAGCDPSLSVLAAFVARKSPEHQLTWLHAPSEEALRELAGGTVHVAGTHLPDRGDYNISQARRTLARDGGLVVTYASWEQGLVVAAGDPKRIRGAADLVRPGLRIVNREAGSGARKLLDSMLLQARVPSPKVRGYDVIAAGHMAVARAVAGGSADAGVALRAAAHAFGLGFVPLAEVRFDLVIPAAHVDHPTVRVMLDVLQSRALKADLAALPGYEVSHTGSTVMRLEAA